MICGINTSTDLTVAGIFSSKNMTSFGKKFNHVSKIIFLYHLKEHGKKKKPCEVECEFVAGTVSRIYLLRGSGPSSSARGALFSCRDPPNACQVDLRQVERYTEKKAQGLLRDCSESSSKQRTFGE